MEKKELVNLLGTVMMPNSAASELEKVFDHRTPEELVLVMKRQDIGKERPIYKTSIYISKEDFEQYRS